MKVRVKTLPDGPDGGAWLPSARTVRRAVKSVNERDPYPMLVPGSPESGHSWGTARDKWEEGTGDGKSVCPSPLGCTRDTMGATVGCDPERGSKSPKSVHSSDRGLELALVKPESLVGEG